MSTREIGTAGEDIAETYLVRHGFYIVCKNWTIPGGELDIIAEKDRTIIFVEVKLRTTTLRGHARESLSMLKKKRLRRSGLLYAMKQRIPEENIRFDFIAIQKSSRGYRIEHFCNIEV